MKIVTFLFFQLCLIHAFSQDVNYPYPVNSFHLKLEGKDAVMAYMDVKPANYNGKNVILFHGKNFNGFYWHDVIKFLTEAGYRVIVPDQIGWGKSSKPIIHYNFYMLAHNNQLLLDHLGVKKVFVIGHSMGGMLATRFTLMYPNRVEKLVLENPIGLEDYSAFVPYKSLEQLITNELQATYESIKNYQRSYYPVWKEEYEPYVRAQAAQLDDPDFSTIAKVNALTYQMIYEQPVLHNFDSLKVPVLLIIGQEDRTVLGKSSLTEEQKKIYGQYPALGKKINGLIPDSKLIEMEGVGHIPHIQAASQFNQHLFFFLNNK